jgi:membrane protein DedA with SNARE-associated domain
VFPTSLAAFLELVRQNGELIYSLMFGYASAHALLIALFAGYVAASGALNLTALIVVCWLGSFTGDVLRFWIGRRYGARWFRSTPKLERVLNSTARLTDRYDVWMILFHRYPYGVRGIAAFAYGMSDLTWPRFLALNFLAAGLWSCGVVSVGYAFGQVSEKLLSDASSGLGMAMLVLFLGGAWIMSRKLERLMARD